MLFDIKCNFKLVKHFKIFVQISHLCKVCFKNTKSVINNIQFKIILQYFKI